MVDSKGDLDLASQVATLEHMAYLLDIEELLDTHADASLDVHERLSVILDAATHVQRTMVDKEFNPHSFRAKETATVLGIATGLVLLLEAASSRYSRNPDESIFMLNLLLCGFYVGFLGHRLWLVATGPVGLKAQASAAMQGLLNPRRSERLIEAHILAQAKQRNEIRMLKSRATDSSFKEQAESLQVDFDQLSKTFDSVLESKKMLQAQNAALSVHIEQRADNFVKLTSKYNDLLNENRNLRQFKDSVGAVVRDQAQIKLTLEQVEAMRQETIETQDQANKKLDEACQKYEVATKKRDEAIEYAKETNRDCTKLKEVMKETQKLECERATLLRQMEWDSVKAFEEKLKKQEDDEKMRKEANNHVSAKGELLKGEHNSYGPAFRYGASAPRLGESSRPLKIPEGRKKEVWALVYADSARKHVEKTK